MTGFSFKNPEIQEKVQKLRERDNYTNFYYLFRTYLFIFLVIGATIWFYQYQSIEGLSFWWSIPVTLFAIALIGGGQHQLVGLGHEGAHHILFKNRILNELISDWFCMFPVFSTTYHYRLSHLGHHQFVNDPERDPDINQLRDSGHYFSFPQTKKQFLLNLFKELWFPNLIRYFLGRAKEAAFGNKKNPYYLSTKKTHQLVNSITSIYFIGSFFLLATIAYYKQTQLILIIPPILWIIILGFYKLVPLKYFPQFRLRPVFSLRKIYMMRATYGLFLFWLLSWLWIQTGHPAPIYFLILWLIPLVTSFSFFMILRQLVQHMNADQGVFTNTRIFFIDRIINFFVFPIGQDFHLPHHLFATVPHYHLKDLHKVLLGDNTYRQKGTIVKGYFFNFGKDNKQPTVLDVLGPGYAPTKIAKPYVDPSALVYDKVEG